MRIAIFDADLIGRNKHRFPNLACEKISGYWKDKGVDVELITEFPPEQKWRGQTSKYDEIYISKVFTDTPVPTYINEKENVHLGGTGFYFDKAPALPDEIEHHMPDYTLYNDWIESQADKAVHSRYKAYTDYSIGFLTRGCFRKCKFCVNQKYDHVFKHSPLEEFYDPTRKKLCFLDDNFFGCPQWKVLLQQVISTNKPFIFKQGLDERLLTEERAEMLFSARYDGSYTFAFDNVADYDLIHKKLEIINKYNTKHKHVTFYVLVGFESVDATDIANAFKRIELLFRYRCLPYIMRYMNKDGAPWQHSKYKELYIAMARWCNQPNFAKTITFREFCNLNQQALKTQNMYCSAMRGMLEFEKDYPEIAKQYFDIRFGG